MCFFRFFALSTEFSFLSVCFESLRQTSRGHVVEWSYLDQFLEDLKSLSTKWLWVYDTNLFGDESPVVDFEGLSWVFTRLPGCDDFWLVIHRGFSTVSRWSQESICWKTNSRFVVWFARKEATEQAKVDKQQNNLPKPILNAQNLQYPSYSPFEKTKNAH